MEEAPQTLAEKRAALQARLDASLQAGRGMLKRIEAIRAAIALIDAEEAASPLEENKDGE